MDRILNTQAQFNQKEHPTSDIHELNDCEEIIGQQKPAKTSGALNWAHAGKIPNHSHNVEQEQLRQGGYKNISSGSDNPPLKRLGRGKYENIFNDPDDVKEQRLGPVEYTAIPRGRRSAHRGIPVLGVEPGYSDSNSIRTPSDLRKAINECKPHRWVDANITWKDVPFHQETCTTQVLNIEFQTTATNGISVFVEKKDDKMEMKSLLKANKTDFALFSNVLVDIATVMQLETAAIIMFVADEGALHPRVTCCFSSQ